MASERKTFIAVMLFVIALVLRLIYGNHSLMLLLIVYLGVPMMIQALKNLKYGIVGIDLLISIAVIGSVILGEYWEGAAVTFLFFLGETLERAVLSKTRQSVRKLIKSVPNSVFVLKGDVEIKTEIEEVQVNDRVILKPGTMIAVDGIVESGAGSVNQAAITGESVTVEKTIGMEVFAGTMLEEGHLVMTVTKSGDDTAYASIVALVESAQDEKTESQKTIDRFARYYTPAILVLAIVSGIIMRDIRIALTLLVVSCPGALVIAAPITIISGVSAATKNDVLIKSAQTLEDLTRSNLFVFDKTGTLTRGKPYVKNIIEVDRKRDEVLYLAAVGERFSEHPIAEAILKAVGSIVEEADEYEMLPGKGVRFNYRDRWIKLGNKSLFQNFEDSFYEGNETIVIVGDDNSIYGIIELSDEIKVGAKETLQSVNHEKMILTGDNELAAQRVAKELGINEVIANQLPAQKSEHIRRLKLNRTVTMVGDGINDAPALASADLGISIGGAHNTVAMEVSDMIIMDGDISKLKVILSIAEKTTRTMKQNIVISIITAVVLLLGVLTSKVGLGLGMFIHEATILIVIFNALKISAKGGLNNGI